ncbi:MULTISPECIES: ATP-binding domain-containing protein [Paenibacillus]|uniref:ATP-binding domain-containing protein n=1 Tax=Paenibacillus TaxID=44249 RepID=UPI0021167B6F|nr:ATP-binding domain-containing protein [Paenibacillus lautus]
MRDERILKDIEALKVEGFDSIAVITKTAAESRAAFESLQVQGSEALQLITKETVTFEKGAMVIPVYLAKGVEFDAVLIYEASSRAYSRENDRKLLYTACTHVPCTGFMYMQRATGRRSCRHCLLICMSKQHIDGSMRTPFAISCCP